MQKLGPRSKLRFPVLYFQQLAIPHVKHGLFFSNARPHAVPEIRACLCINPSVRAESLPPALLCLPHIQGTDASERIEGESVSGLLGIG